jgi:hypothetical protein
MAWADGRPLSFVAAGNAYRSPRQVSLPQVGFKNLDEAVADQILAKTSFQHDLIPYSEGDSRNRGQSLRRHETAVGLTPRAACRVRGASDLRSRGVGFRAVRRSRVDRQRG